MRGTDVVIVGGGVMGCSVAYHLARLGKRSASIAVIERDSAYSKSSSALSVGSIRQQFSTPTNIAMSQYGLEFIRSAGRRLSTASYDVELDFVAGSYLYLATSEGSEILRRNYAMQKGYGVSVAPLDRTALRKRFPTINAADIEFAVLGLKGEGWFDGYSLTMGFRRKSQEMGVDFIEDEVTSVQDSCGWVAKLSSGRSIECTHLVNAAGPWAARIGQMVGMDLPVQAEKRAVFVVDCPSANKGFPLVVDPTGLYFRPERDLFLVGAPQSCTGSDQSLQVDHSVFDKVVWPTLAHRVPAFEALKVRGAWAGYYEMNKRDANALIGPCGDNQNLWLINGFSGHGLQHAPAAGRGLAELILFGHFKSLDLSAFHPQRHYRHDRVERNVI